MPIVKFVKIKCTWTILVLQYVCNADNHLDSQRLVQMPGCWTDNTLIPGHLYFIHSFISVLFLLHCSLHTSTLKKSSSTCLFRRRYTTVLLPTNSLWARAASGVSDWLKLPSKKLLYPGHFCSPTVAKIPRHPACMMAFWLNQLK